MQVQRQAALSAEIGRLQKNAEQLSGQIKLANESIIEKGGELERLKEHYDALEKYRVSLGLLNFKERKSIDEERLPSMKAEIDVLEAEIPALLDRVGALSAQKNECENAIKQKLTELDNLQMALAADTSEAERLFETGSCYFKNDKQKAADYFQKAADGGHIEATRLLAAMHTTDAFAGANLKYGVELIEKLVNTHNDPSDIIWLGIGASFLGDKEKSTELIYKGVSEHKGEVAHEHAVHAAPILIFSGAEANNRDMVQKGVALAKKTLNNAKNLSEDVYMSLRRAVEAAEQALG